MRTECDVVNEFSSISGSLNVWNQIMIAHFMIDTFVSHMCMQSNEKQ